jgi:hypothetical protein
MKLSRQRIHAPSHSWLKVLTSEVCNLGLKEKISSFSYVSSCKKYMYLEEDCDMDIYLKALNSEVTIINKYLKRRSKIRNLDCYTSFII